MAAQMLDRVDMLECERVGLVACLRRVQPTGLGAQGAGMSNGSTVLNLAGGNDGNCCDDGRSAIRLKEGKPATAFWKSLYI